MLKLSVMPLLHARGVKNKTAYLQKMGMSYHAARYIVGDHMHSFNLQVVEKICLALDCTPNDLLFFVPSSQDVPKTHPLHSLHKDRFRDELAEGVQQLSPTELELLKEQLRLLLERKNKD